ncbi:hypothetical protein PN294_13400 [Romboutsia sp. 1001216sp1]|uniref:hypothetical protein n=1 Tax=unclassified Romboutsia TaxID=2626894 RepID=UPI00189E86E4|nr:MULTISPECIES: hypothetical protein [unclassified Romboutsia]MDB8803179.1 hypothetical protein [Romboutsia sp. 1001216sp1]MDB8814538.1 hypothetical protein [Romboutsia sp. 1001216sp1]
MNEDFITSDIPKAFIDKIGKDYVIIKDIDSKEEMEIEVEEGLAEYFKNEFPNGEVIYVLYDKENKKLIL